MGGDRFTSANGGRVFGTFGFCRYVLACMVVITHTLPAWDFVGVYAVFAFFILSGYIVTYILHYTYLPLPQGLWKYMANRALRIYPAYWIALALSAVLIVQYPQQAREVFPAIGLPGSGWQWLANGMAFGMSNPVTGKLVEPALLPISWSLGVEMSWWIIMPWLLLRKDLRSLAYFAALLYAVLVLVMSLPHPSSDSLSPRYFSGLAAALPFCAGLLLFLAKQQGRLRIPHGLGLTGIAAFFIFMMAIPRLFTEKYFMAFYVAIGLEALILAYASQFDQRNLPPRVRALDNAFGNLAYPIFLLHLPVAMALHIAFPAVRLYHGAYCLTVIALSSLAGLLLHQGVEVPVNRLKQAIKC